jgi:hypothetical protein
VMPKDLARAEHVVEFIELLEKHAPTGRSAKPRLVGGRAQSTPTGTARM